MSEFKIGFSAAISGIDTKSLDKASIVIKDYMERNTKLRKAFSLPPINAEGATAALDGLNAKVMRLKNNIATIGFDGIDGPKELDVSLGGSRLKVLGSARKSAEALSDQMAKLKVDIINVSRELEKCGTAGGESGSQLAKMFDSAVLSMEEIKNKSGEVTKRIISIQGEGQKVNKIFQTWNDSTRTFETQSTKISEDYKKIQVEVDKTGAKLNNMFGKSIDDGFKEKISGFQKELSEIDVYSESAGEALKKLNLTITNTSNAFSQGQTLLSEYKRQLAAVGNAQLELERLKGTKNSMTDSHMKGIAVAAAEENIRLSNEEIAKLKEKLTVLGLVTQAEVAEANAKSKSTAQISKFNAEQSKSKNIMANFASGMKDATARVLNYTIVYRALWGVVRIFRDSIETTKELDKAFTDIQMVMLESGESVDRLASQYAALAHEMSSSVVDIAKGASDWLRQGKSLQETNELLRASTVMSKVGSLEAAQATEYLTSVLNGFKLEAKDAMGVVDALSMVDVESASSVADLAVALQRSANSASMAGVQFETLIGWIAEVKEVTQKSASSIGESFKTILARMGSVKAGTFLDTDLESEFADLDSYINDTEKVLGKVGIALRTSTHDFRDAEDVINEVAASWEKYSDLEQQAIATSLAGQRQRENFVALMENYERATDLATSALNSNGAAMEKYEVYRASIEAGLERITALWQTLIIRLGENGALKDIINIVENFMKVLSSEAGAMALKWGTLPSIVIGACLKMIPAIKAYEVAQKAAAAADIATAEGMALKAVASKAMFGVAALAATAAIVAFTIVGQAIDELIVTTDELRESLAGTIEDINSLTSELDSLNDKLETTQDRMKELYSLRSNGGLSLVEKDELSALEKENAALAVQIALKKDEEELARRKAAREATDLNDSGVESRTQKVRVRGPRSVDINTMNEAFSDGNTELEDVWEPKIISRSDALKENVVAIKQNIDATNSLMLKDGDHTKELEKLDDEYQALLKETGLYVADVQKIAEYSPDEGIRKSAEEALAMYTLFNSDASTQMSSLFSSEKYKKEGKALLDLAKKGTLSAEMLEKANNGTGKGLKELISILKWLGFEIPDIVNGTYELANGMSGVDTSTRAASVSIKTYGEIIGELDKQVEIVTKAQYELSQTGIITAETVAALEEEFGDLNGIVSLTEAGFISTDIALQGLLSTTRAQYELELDNARNAAVAVLQAEGDKSASYKMTTEKIKEQLIAKRELLKVDMAASQTKAVRDEVRMSGGSYADLGLEDPSVSREKISAINEALKAIENAELNASNFEQILSQLQASSTEKLKEKGSSGSDKKEETAYERQIRLLEHKLFLSQQLSEIYNEDPEKQDEYASELARQDSIFKELQSAAHEQAKLLRSQGKKDTDKEIQELQQAWWGYEIERRNLAKETADYIDELNQKNIEKTEDILDKLKDAVNNLLDQAQMKLEEEQKTYDYRIKQLEATVSLTESYYDVMNNIRSETKAINDELKISKQSYKYLDETLRKTIFNDEDYAALSNKLDNIASDTESIYSAYANEINNLTEDNIYRVEEITNEFQRQYQLKQMEFGIVKAELSLVKAQTELQNTLANRNVRMFTGGEWKWTSDYKAVEGAMENVASAENDVIDQKVKMQQQMVTDNYQRMIDNIQLQSDAAQNTYDEMERMWKRIEKSLELPVETINDVLVQIADSNLPMLQDIIAKVSGSLGTLLTALGTTEAGANRGYDGSLSKNPLSTSNGNISFKEHLENKVAWKAAMDRGDLATADKLHGLNNQYRQENGILSDKISPGDASDMLNSKLYDSGGILSGIGGIKATKEDEVVFDGALSSKMLNPYKSRSFLEIADGLSTMLDSSGGILSKMKSFSGDVSQHGGTSDSHDIYIDGAAIGNMSKQDSDSLTSIIRRYIPITR